MSRPYLVYHAEPRVHDLPLVIRAMASGAFHARYAAYRIFVRDVKAEYARSLFGFFWSFIDPLVVGVIFYFLFRARVINPGELQIPYVVFVVFGALLYQTFVDAFQWSLNVLQRSGSLLAQLNLSPEALLLACIYRVLFNASFRIAVMLIFAAAFGTISLAGAAKFLACFPLVILPGLTCGVLLAPFHTLYQDVGRIGKVVVDLLRYVSPVLYPLPAMLPFNVLEIVNPLAPIINLLRSLATLNEPADLMASLMWAAVLTIAGLLGWLIFHVSIPILADRT